MRALLSFNLPDDRQALHLAQLGPGLHAVLHSFLHVWLRNKLRHGHEFKTADDALEAVQTELLEELAALEINFDAIE